MMIGQLGLEKINLVRAHTFGGYSICFESVVDFCDPILYYVCRTNQTKYRAWMTMNIQTKETTRRVSRTLH